MKLADFFVQLGVKGDTKELDKTIKQLEEAERKSSQLIKYRKDLAKAATDEEKALVKKNFADKINLENARKQKTVLTDQHNALMGIIKGLGAFTIGATIAYKAIDRMVNSLATANSRMIAFQRQTGISFASLNKYASASASVNFNSTPEQVANTMQNLASNLYDIRMGRGDISPYQELSFVGGKSFNPMGMSVEQLIENVREAIKGVGDVQATNLITRMGFSPDDLLMLRMTREEFEKVNDLFLSPREREQMNAYSLQIKKMRLEFQLMKDRALLAIMPAFIKLTNKINDLSIVWGNVLTSFTQFIQKSPVIESMFKGITLALTGMLAVTKPLYAGFMAIYLVLEDLAYWYAGKGSLFGDIFGERGSEKYKDSAIGKATNAIGSGWGTINKAWELYQATRKGEMTGEEANETMRNYLGGILNKQEVVPPTNQTNTTYTNTNNKVNQNFSIYTAETAQEVQNSLNLTPIGRQLAPQGF